MLDHVVHNDLLFVHIWADIQNGQDNSHSKILLSFCNLSFLKKKNIKQITNKECISLI